MFTVIPGTCSSSLFRGFPLLISMIWQLLLLILARTPEQGGRVAVNALLDDRAAERFGGAIVNNDEATEESDFLLSNPGEDIERRVWVCLHLHPHNSC
jgi:hypothetical protein